jgi:predicted transcriptional regulator
MSSSHSTKALDLTGQIVSAFVRKNPMAYRELPTLIAQVHSAVNGLSLDIQTLVLDAKSAPAVSIKKSITAEYLICLEDGKKFKTMKRHLLKAFNLTPDQYRQKWDLPKDYPMVAPGYSARRKAVALEAGLGRKAKISEVAPVTTPEAVAEKSARKRLHLPFFNQSKNETV